MGLLINNDSYVNDALFIKNNDLYYLISLYNKNKYIIYNFKNGLYIRDMFIEDNSYGSNNNIIYFKLNYIIQLNNQLIRIIDFITSEYKEINNGLKNKNCIYSKERNIFIIFVETYNNSYIDFYDMDRMLLLRQIEIKNFKIINNFQ